MKAEYRPSVTRPKYFMNIRLPNLLHFESNRLKCGGTPVELQIAFINMTSHSEPILIALTDKPGKSNTTYQMNKKPIKDILFTEKTVDWLVQEMELIGSTALHMPRPSRANRMEKLNLKVLSLLINRLLRQLMFHYPKETRGFVHGALGQIDFRQRSLSLATWKPNMALLQSHLGIGLMKTVPKDSTVFLSADDPENPARNKEIVQSTMDTLRSDLLSGLHTDKTSLLVGFPLLVALWQVFELRAVQYIGKQRLASAVIEEQRQIINAIVGYDPTLDSTYDFVSFGEFMALRVKRFQFSLFFLCDAISFDETFVNDSFLKHLLRLGRYFEWEAALARDIDGFQYDTQPIQVQRTHNSLVFWLRRQGKELVLHQDSLQEFTDEMAKTSLKFHVSELKGIACLGDLNSFKQAIQRITLHYLKVDSEEEICKASSFCNEESMKT